MKKLLVLTFLTFGIVFGTVANGNNITVEDRATNLTNQMIRELRLNNFQANKVRSINLDKIAKIMAVEEANAGNQEVIDAKYKEICAERDRELENVLSTAQYNDYFGSRKAFTNFDKEFMANAGQEKSDENVAASSVSNASAEPRSATSIN